MLWEWEGLLGESEVMLDGEVGRGVPLGGRQSLGRRGKGVREGENGQMAEKKAARLLSHQNQVVCLEASIEEGFSDKQRELIEKLLQRRKMLMKAAMLLLAKVLRIENWMIEAELISSERELLGGESLSL